MIRTFIKGIHHLTATVGNAQADYDFYTKLLGLRLVKKTVNFDNNKVYHFYYGDKRGTPGTIMTTFPYEGQGIRQGTIGTGQVKISCFSVPQASLAFWKERLEQAGVSTEDKQRFGESVLRFRDPSGLILELIGNDTDQRESWTTADIPAEVGIKGFFTVQLLLAEAQASFDFFTQELGFEQLAEEGSTFRFAIQGGGPGKWLDVQIDPNAKRGKGGMGTVHHVAWQIDNDVQLKQLHTHLTKQLGFTVTEIKDRKYFHSLYFRIPGGVLFEVATTDIGFEKDEPIELLGQRLQLPPWVEEQREEIEQILPPIRS